MNIKVTNVLLIVVSIFLACSDNVVENGKNLCPPIDIVAQPPYNNPIWYPSGKFIGFNYTPLDSITYPYGKNCIGVQHFNYDSTGFWLVNTDGTNMRRIFPYQLFLAAWSPDGKWIAFVNNARIYKMPFIVEEERFDTTQIEQLTFEGKNFFPAWSPDGKWIAFDSNKDHASGGYRIWKMEINGLNKSLILDGRMPIWTKDSKSLFYVGLYSEIFKVHLNNPSNIIQVTHLNETNNYQTDNRNPKLSFASSQIAFWSNSNIWSIDTTGADLKQITTRGVDADFGLPFDWSPDDEKIVYTQYNDSNWNYDNGVLWIINTNTGTEFQLTFNTVKK